jgi:hypothetical protein
MRTALAFVTMLCCVLSPAIAASEPKTAPPAVEINFGENLFKAFLGICLANRGSSSGSAQAAEKSDFQFKKTEIKKTQQIEFSDFPLEVVLKRFGKNRFACLAQSVVEGSPSASSLAERLKVSGPGLSEVTFVAAKGGMDGTLPKPATIKKKGKQTPDVIVRVSPSILKDASTVQFLVFSESLEPPEASR